MVFGRSKLWWVVPTSVFERYIFQALGKPYCHCRYGCYNHSQREAPGLLFPKLQDKLKEIYRACSLD